MKRVLAPGLLVAAALSLGLATSNADIAASITEGPEQKLTPAAGQLNGMGLLGFSVSMSADGQTALVGAPADDGYVGAAWVWTRSGGKWMQQGGPLTPSEPGSEDESCEEEAGGSSSEEGPECGFGRAVALSADGNTALIGAPRENKQQGAAWVFTRVGGVWSLPVELTGTGETLRGRFGRAVALSADGSTAIVSAPGDEAGHGRVWAFKRSGSNWSQQGSSFVGAGTVGEAHFGSSLALAGNGETALIGAPGDSEHLGAAWVFTRTGEEWSEQGSKLTGSGAEVEAHFGASVALSGDGTTALVGARDQAEGKGAVWVLSSTGFGFAPQGTPLTGNGEAGEEFGYSVALSGDGSSALIGAPHDHSARGAAWLFDRSGTAWSTSPKLLEGGAGELGKAWFGASVSLSGDARSALVGAPGDHAKAGAAFVFGPGPSVVGVSPDQGPTTGGTTVTISGANFGEASAVSFGGSAAAGFTVTSPSSITALSPPGHGTVDITVQSPYGTSLSSSNDHFRYVAEGAGSNNGTNRSSSTQGSSTGGGAGGVLGFSSSSGGGCGVALLAKRITVLGGRASVRLHGTGVGRCAGKLRLRVKARTAHGHSTLKTIATGTFTLTPGRTVVLRMKLNAAGRRRFSAGHGHLNASLLLVRSSPSPLLARAASVSLSRQQGVRKATPRK
jgi:hypothetical protein